MGRHGVVPSTGRAQLGTPCLPVTGPESHSQQYAAPALSACMNASEHAAARRAWIEEQVAKAPPLTPEQRRNLAILRNAFRRERAEQALREALTDVDPHLRQQALRSALKAEEAGD